MIEIIPNWHPILVHFSIGLLSTSVLFYVASYFSDRNFRLQRQWLHTANWTLWIGCLFAIITVMAGWHAYNTVSHDAASHAAMTLHRNWAIPTAVVFIILGLSAFRIVKLNRRPTSLFLSCSFIALLMLMTTGWLGAEAVYRHGLGVISLPQVEESGHHHSHGSHENGETDLDLVPDTHNNDDMPVEAHNHAEHQH